MRDSLQRFSAWTVGLHWLIAAGMIAMLAFGLYLEALPRSPEKGELVGLHKSFGVLILLFAAWRFLWRLRNGMPGALGNPSPTMHRLAGFTHWFLLLGTLFMPISGVMMSVGSGFGVGVFDFELVAVAANTPGFEPNEGLREIGKIVHGLGGKLLILAVLLHVAGALKHHWIDRDKTLIRMLGKSAQA